MENNRKLKIVTSTISYTLGAITLFIIITLLPVPHNFQLLTVLSGSMEPTIKTGSIILIKPITNYKINDIITFQSQGEIVTHRIYGKKVKNDIALYITKGDANNGPDIREITKKNVRGKVFLDIPYLGYGVNLIQRAIRKPVVFLSLIIGLVALVVGKEGKEIKKEIIKNKSKK